MSTFLFLVNSSLHLILSIHPSNYKDSTQAGGSREILHNRLSKALKILKNLLTNPDHKKMPFALQYVENHSKLFSSFPPFQSITTVSYLKHQSCVRVLWFAMWHRQSSAANLKTQTQKSVPYLILEMNLSLKFIAGSHQLHILHSSQPVLFPNISLFFILDSQSLTDIISTLYPRNPNV